MKERSGWFIRNQYGAHFVTFTIVGWVNVFSRKACRDIIMKALQYGITHKGLTLHAYVIMGNHLHLAISAKEGSSGLSAIIRDFKKFTSKELIRWIKNNPRERRREWMLMVFKYHAKYNKRNAVYQVWQQHNKPKELCYPRFTQQKINYIHLNPVVAGIVDLPEDYIYSSARNYIGRNDGLIDIEVLDFGCQEGFVFV